MKNLKVTVVSGGRSDYGPLKNILHKLVESESIDLNIVLTGTHLDPEYGCTADEVIEDGFVVHKRIDIRSETSGPEANAHSMAKALKEFSSYFSVSKPDILLGLGDRYELFAVVAAAVSMGVPVGHIGGGDITDGALDEFWRHGITKLSTFHFPALGQHADRIISMGENPQKVCVIGEPAIENIHKLELLAEEKLFTEFGWESSKKKILVTYHPETASKASAENQFLAVLKVLEELSAENILFTFANSDHGGDEINRMIKQAVSLHKNWLAVESLGSFKYLSCLNCFDLVVGNSSSALIEAPSFNVPAVNIGTRQAGRLAPDNVVAAEYAEESIRNAIKTALDKSFVECLNGTVNPYFHELGSQKVLEFLLGLKEEDFLKKNSWEVC